MIILRLPNREKIFFKNFTTTYITKGKSLCFHSLENIVDCHQNEFIAMRAREWTHEVNSPHVRHFISLVPGSIISFLFEILPIHWHLSQCCTNFCMSWSMEGQQKPASRTILVVLFTLQWSPVRPEWQCLKMSCPSTCETHLLTT